MATIHSPIQVVEGEGLGKGNADLHHRQTLNPDLSWLRRDILTQVEVFLKVDEGRSSLYQRPQILQQRRHFPQANQAWLNKSNSRSKSELTFHMCGYKRKTVRFWTACRIVKTDPYASCGAIKTRPTISCHR